MNEAAGTGCEKCCAAEAESAWGQRLAQDHALVEDVHFGVAIRRCRDCGQRFVTIFTEFVDWVDGDDPQYADRIPITEDESREICALDYAGALERIRGIGSARRRLRMNSPKGGPRTVEWVTGALWIVEGH